MATFNSNKSVINIKPGKYLEYLIDIYTYFYVKVPIFQQMPYKIMI